MHATSILQGLQFLTLLETAFYSGYSVCVFVCAFVCDSDPGHMDRAREHKLGIYIFETWWPEINLFRFFWIFFTLILEIFYLDFGFFFYLDLGFFFTLTLEIFDLDIGFFVSWLLWSGEAVEWWGGGVVSGGSVTVTVLECQICSWQVSVQAVSM